MFQTKLYEAVAWLLRQHTSKPDDATREEAEALLQALFSERPIGTSGTYRVTFPDKTKAIACIKVMREALGIGLADAKRLWDASFGLVGLKLDATVAAELREAFARHQLPVDIREEA